MAPRHFHDIKRSTLAPPTSRTRMVAAGNLDVLAEAAVKHGTQKRRRIKRARAGKVDIGFMQGGPVRARLDRVQRKGGGRIKPTGVKMTGVKPRARADGGAADDQNLEPPPGSDRLNYKEPGINSMGIGSGNFGLARPDLVDASGNLRQITPDEAKSMAGNLLAGRAADLLGLPGDIERAVTPGLDYVGKKLGYDWQLSKHPVFPGAEDVRRQLKGDAAPGRRAPGGRAR
jgi:hypothetical protein